LTSNIHEAGVGRELETDDPPPGRYRTRTALLFAGWGSFLLLRDDPDGGAHAGGWFMLGCAVALAIPLAISYSLRSKHRSAKDTWLRGSLAVAAVLGMGVLLLLVFGTP